MAYEIGDRVTVNLKGLMVLGASDFSDRDETSGTVVDKPGGILYNIRLDEPLPPNVATIDFIGGSRLKPLSP